MTHERTQYLLTRYISNSITKEELEELKIQINISDDEKVLYELSALWENHPIEDIQDPSILREALKIIEINTRTQTIRKQLRFLLRIAGILLLPVLCTLATYLYMDKQTQPFINNKVIVEAQNGHRAAVILPDGLKVNLNSGSYISYLQSFGKKVREIKLSGKAIFEVTKDPKKKFIVNTEYINIEVLGTTFNVYAYEKENTVEMVLLTGQVKINTNKAPYQSYYVKPNEKISLDKQSGTLKIKKTDARFETAWLRDEMVFRSERLETVFDKLERKYGVTIQYENFKQENDRFTGSFNNEELTGILDILKIHYHFTYKVLGNRIIIYGEK